MGMTRSSMVSAVRSLRGRDHFLDLRFGDPTVHELRAVVWYTNGSKDTIRIAVKTESLQNRPLEFRFKLSRRGEPAMGAVVRTSVSQVG